MRPASRSTSAAPLWFGQQRKLAPRGCGCQSRPLPRILAKLEKGSLDEDLTLALAQEAFSHTASYDMLIAGYLAKQAAPSVQYPQKLFLEYEKVCDLRYGENPHQQAAFYRETNPEPLSLAQAQQLHGKELSFNNINDANGAISLLAEFAEPTAVAVQHTNPCGVAAGKNIYEGLPCSL